MVYSSNNSPDVTNINDSNNATCTKVGGLNANWLAIDMKNIMEVTSIVIQSHKDLDSDPVSVFIANEFQPCKIHKQFKEFQLCKIILIGKKQRFEFQCDQAGIKGQYLILMKGEFGSTKVAERLTACEIEAYGQILTDMKPRLRPLVESQTLAKFTANDFNIARDIRRGMTDIKIPAYSQSFSYVSNCQPLIWDKSSSLVSSLVCMSLDGKGRMATFAKQFFFRDLIKDKKRSPFTTNLIKWLSMDTPNPSIIDKVSLSSLNDLIKKVKKGDIIDFNVPNPYKPDVLSAIVSLVKNGTIGVVVDWTFFAGTSKEARDSYMAILNIFNVDFNEGFTTWSSTQNIPLSDDDFNENILSVDAQVSRMSKDHNIFLEKGLTISDMVNKFPISILQSTDVKENMQNIVNKYKDLLDYICPCKASPAINKEDRQLIDIFSQFASNQLLRNSNYKLPCIDLFPGDFETTPKKNTVTLIVEGQNDNTDNPIGFYLEAGATLTYEVQQSQGTWSIGVGCQTDRLGEGRPEWTRYPDIYIDRIVLDKNGKIYSPFGGVLWLNNAKKNQSITITLSNVVATPFFNLRDKNAAINWDNQKNNPGLWSIIAGDNMVICEKSEKVRHLSGKYLENLMSNHWDKLVKMDFAIKGINWKERRPERTVLDIMTSVGYGHSGYPIEVWDDWHDGIFNDTLILRAGSWGMCHEIGHNMQDGRWTFDGCGEVTNNLLCLYNYDKLWHVPTFGHNISLLRGQEKTIVKHLNEEANYESWKSNPWIALAIYSQMANQFGWGFYKDVFQFYETNIPSLSSNDDKIAMWINVTSKIATQNLVPMFEFWGLPVSEKVRNEVSNLPCFFPDDFFSKMSTIRTNYIKSKYTNCNSKSIFYKDFDPSKEIEGIRPNFIN